jgi:hypothetical protein
MHLGELMSRLESEADAAEALAALGDLPLFAQVEIMGARHDESPGAYVANAARRFAARAGDEDWLALMTAMERAHDPARAALVRMLGWALRSDEAEIAAPEAATPGPKAGGCSCGGGGGGCHDHPAG